MVSGGNVNGSVIVDGLLLDATSHTPSQATYQKYCWHNVLVLSECSDDLSSVNFVVFNCGLGTDLTLRTDEPPTK